MLSTTLRNPGETTLDRHQALLLASPEHQNQTAAIENSTGCHSLPPISWHLDGIHHVVAGLRPLSQAWHVSSACCYTGVTRGSEQSCAGVETEERNYSNPF